MRKDRIRVVRDVTQKLNALEGAIDDALACAAELSSAVSTGRQEAKISAVIGQDAIGLTGETIQSLFDARAKVVEAHGAYAVARDQMGLRTIAGGDWWKDPTRAIANEMGEEGATDKKEVAQPKAA